VIVEYCTDKYQSSTSEALLRTLKVKETVTHKTALLIAVQSNQTVQVTQAYVKLLIELGADCSETTSEGLGVVHIAAMCTTPYLFTSTRSSD
jgi:hypothetical protein